MAQELTAIQDLEPRSCYKEDIIKKKVVAPSTFLPMVDGPGLVGLFLAEL